MTSIDDCPKDRRTFTFNSHRLGPVGKVSLNNSHPSSSSAPQFPSSLPIHNMSKQLCSTNAHASQSFFSHHMRTILKCQSCQVEEASRPCTVTSLRNRPKARPATATDDFGSLPLILTLLLRSVVMPQDHKGVGLMVTAFPTMHFEPWNPIWPVSHFVKLVSHLLSGS